ncbi:MAG: hypothetical protein VW175_07165, partial [Alphaproteobacteria bacterium]
MAIAADGCHAVTLSMNAARSGLLIHDTSSGWTRNGAAFSAYFAMMVARLTGIFGVPLGKAQLSSTIFPEASS